MKKKERGVGRKSDKFESLCASLKFWAVTVGRLVLIPLSSIVEYMLAYM